MSEDDLDDVLKTNKPWKKHRPSTDLSEPAVKKRRSSGNKIIEVVHVFVYHGFVMCSIF